MVEVKCDLCGKHLGEVPDMEEFRRRVWTHLNFCPPLQAQIAAELTVRKVEDKPRLRRVMVLAIVFACFIGAIGWAVTAAWMHLLPFWAGLAMSIFTMVFIWPLQHRVTKHMIDWSYTWKCAPPYRKEAHRDE